MLLPVVLGVLGAALLGVGFVVQQREAACTARDDSLSVRLLLELMRRRRWWLGIAAMAAGYVLAGWSLGSGNLVLVEPLLASNLLFALLVAARWRRRRPAPRSLLGAAALAAGVVGFVLAGDPHGGRTVHIPPADWRWSGAVVAAVVVTLVAAATRRHGTVRAAMLGTATGAVYGMQDALTRRVYGAASHGLVHLLASWPAWTLVAVGALGVLLAQNAFDAAELTASLPAISATEPVTGIVLGIAVFGEHVRTAPLWLGVEGACLVVLLGGVVLVSRAPVVREAAAGHGADAYPAGRPARAARRPVAEHP